MPNGSFHMFRGIIAWTRQGYTLFPDGGGYWALELGWWDRRRARNMLGDRVSVEGTRIGFNILAVRKFGRAKLPQYEMIDVGGGCIEMRAKREGPGTE